MANEVMTDGRAAFRLARPSVITSLTMREPVIEEIMADEVMADGRSEFLLARPSAMRGPISHKEDDDPRPSFPASPMGPAGSLGLSSVATRPILTSVVLP